MWGCTEGFHLFTLSLTMTNLGMSDQISLVCVCILVYFAVFSVHSSFIFPFSFVQSLEPWLRAYIILFILLFYVIYSLPDMYLV